nr:MAG TPA: bacterial toxin [Caudoviricetes sp.]
MPVQQGIAGWSTHYGHLWGSIPHPPTRGLCVP